MPLVEVLAAGVVVVAAGFLAVVARRRMLQRGGGTVELSVRLHTAVRGSGWALGIGRFASDELQWYRVLSLSPRPRRTFCRSELRVQRRRDPADAERYAVPHGMVVMECTAAAGLVHMAMDPAAVTGFLAWLEARPPGATLPPV